jgi:hypothetical protein
LVKDSLEYYNQIGSQAKLSVDTLSKADLIRAGSAFLDSIKKIRMKAIPLIARLNENIDAVNFSIDSLSKMK